MYRLHTRCRACGFGPQPSPGGIKSGDNGQKLVPVFDLGIQPLANSFREAHEIQDGHAPLKVMMCPRCSLAQLSVVVDPQVMYRNYSYVTSPSETMKAHFAALYDRLGVAGMKYVVEIGSNDGRMLSDWQQRSGVLAVLGIDPAENLCKIANSNGIPTVCALFDEIVAKNTTPTDPDLVIARHVFCHIDDWKGFIRGLESLGHPETLYVIEVPYVLDMLNNCEFDTVYHEHLSYLSLKAMAYALKDSDLEMVNVERYPIHGGAIAIHLRRRSMTPVSSTLQAMIEEENIGLWSWEAFSATAYERIKQVQRFLGEAELAGKKVAALGASAKSTVWINAAKLTRHSIAFIADTTIQKQFRTSPGSDIPITDEMAIIRERPDFVLLFAWNFVEEVLAKHKAYTDAGGKFVVPVPMLRVLPS